MSKFHSTVSRRTFMKSLGLVGAGLGAAAATAPVFHDLDEVTSSSGASWKRPWYVREADKPTVEIDWSVYNRLDQRQVNDHMPGRGPNATEEGKQIRANNTKFVEEWCTEHYYPDWKGNTIRDEALRAGARAASSDASPGYGAPFLGPQKASTPEDFGMSPWQGTPEENLRMLRAAFRTFGAASVGCFELDPSTSKKIIWAYQQRCGEMPLPLTIVRNKKYEFENVDKAYFTKDKMVIPDNCRYMVVWTTLMTPELTFREGSSLGNASTSLAYNRSSFINTEILEFMRTLGYQALSAYRSNMTPAAPRGQLSGIGEHNRMSFPNLVPEFGSFLRTVNGFVTDLPVAPTKPINAGMFVFCKTCGICARACPYGALPEGDPDWESEFSDHSIFAGNSPGYRGFRQNVGRCTKCGVCQGSCPFNSTKQSVIHTIVSGTLATTPIFNGFLANMETFLDYGIRNPETWWDMNDYPVFGVHPGLLK